MDQTVPWGSKGNWLYFSSSSNNQGGIAPFKMHSLEYDDFSAFFKRYKAAKPPPSNFNMDENYLRKGLELFLDFQSKKLESLRNKMQSQRNSLPVKKFQQEIVDLVKENRVVLIAADTGAGKSTQVPQYLMEAGFDKIGVSQPRRIACYSLAKRVGAESLNRYGSKIAYQVRFDGSKTTDTKVLFLTEGLLLKQFSVDPYLTAYKVLIIDEVHERHLTGDFLLGILKRLLTYRLDIRIVLMSATIQTELFAKYFNAPCIQIPGRMYTVEITYIPSFDKDSNLTDKKFIQEREASVIKQSIPARPIKLKAESYLKILQRIDETVPPTERGDLLVFVSGMNEIATLSESLSSYATETRRWIILPLHSSLSIAAQEKVFDIAPDGVRKCILSTNIAETSVTIDGIRFIIDSGKVKEMGYDPSLGLSKLKEYWISKSSAKQRAGRAGRTGPGICYRFYDKLEYEALNEFPVPEIQRSKLDSTILQIVSLKLGSPFEFDFLERPSEEALKHTIEQLVDLGCLTSSETNVTAIGRVLSLLPVDIVLGKMLVLGSVSSLLKPVLAIASLLSIQSPFARIADGSPHVITKRKSLYSDHGDPFTLLNLFVGWLEIKRSKTLGESKRFCKSVGVEEQRLYEAVKLNDQFEKILASHNLATVLSNHYSKEDRKVKRELEKRKLQDRGSSRKFLKLEEEFNNGAEEDANAELEEGVAEIEELEFELKANAETLLQESDVSSLNLRELTTLKLIVCSGFYPNVAIADESNFARPSSEQTFHTKSQRFLSMLPDSSFAFMPEVLHGKPTQRSEDSGNAENLATLHEKRHSKDLLCYLSLLETTKPYLMNVVRIDALPLILLFSQEVIISHHCMVLIADGWLRLEFLCNSESAMRVLELGAVLRYSWNALIQKKLLSDADDEQNTRTPKYKLDSIHTIPSCMAVARENWFELSLGLKSAGSEVEIMDQLIDFVDSKVDYHIEKLKITTLSQEFEFDPFQSDTSRIVQISPHFKYLLKSPNYTRDARLFTLPSLIAATVTGDDVDVHGPSAHTDREESRRLFECPFCFKSLYLFPGERDAHIKLCGGE